MPMMTDSQFRSLFGVTSVQTYIYFSNNKDGRWLHGLVRALSHRHTYATAVIDRSVDTFDMVRLPAGILLFGRD